LVQLTDSLERPLWLQPSSPPSLFSLALSPSPFLSLFLGCPPLPRSAHIHVNAPQHRRDQLALAGRTRSLAIRLSVSRLHRCDRSVYVCGLCERTPTTVLIRFILCFLAPPLTRLTLGAAVALHTPSARNPKAMLRAPEIRDALVYRSFRGGSNAPSSGAGPGRGGIRRARAGQEGRMRLSNYRGCESASSVSFLPFFFSFRRREGSTRGTFAIVRD